MQFYQLCIDRFLIYFFVSVKSWASVKSLSSQQLVFPPLYTILRVTLSSDFWLKVGGALLQGGKKFAAQISLLLNFYHKRSESKVVWKTWPWHTSWETLLERERERKKEQTFFSSNRIKKQTFNLSRELICLQTKKSVFSDFKR